MKKFEKLIEYVDNWNAIEGIKPKNEPLFVIEFAKLIENYPDEREVSFDGEGSYFGKQVTLEPFSFWGKAPRQLSFEVSYDENNISVYKKDHHGFWTPEFLYMKKGDVDFEDVKKLLFDFLLKTFGLCN